MQTYSGQSPRILLIKLSALGDVIHTLPTLEALRATYPQAWITWLVEEAAAPLLIGHPALDDVWVSRRRSWLRPRQNGLLWARAARELIRLIHRLRKSEFDLVIDIQGLLKSALWVALARSPRKIGYDRTREGSYLVLNERLPPFDREAHAVWRYLNLAQYLGAAPGIPRFRLPLQEDTGVWLAPLWQDRSGPLIVLHPGARWPSKCWPAARFAALADRLVTEQQARVVFTGGVGDRPLIARIKARMQTAALDLSGRTSLLELARLFQQAELAVTTDTGPMHLAAAVGTAVVALFGPTAPWRTGPFGDGHQIVRLYLPCSPCFRRRCPHPECMTGIGVEAVWAAVQQMLAVEKSRRPGA
ncbi:MAG: lipopolysaccharide heptosyltransferase II [Deltaproteobacteria bacterium]|nr:lipopolysaccharide heptosyltransferase II [Deltaproteobacteria bacterium]MBW1953350.1 lipopolysaccharide heptosyltransferase II [Deltaproteobacteria bacterium]MBW1987324.1 lipopolysaccharide heptosyltransferase II [Deltaproteobacteria bacterium]MBW2135065.1 lipopolysaccharide heptosyltransferase II [Deltaproteobacteria bacterium]